MGFESCRQIGFRGQESPECEGMLLLVTSFPGAGARAPRDCGDE